MFIPSKTFSSVPKAFQSSAKIATISTFPLSPLKADTVTFGATKDFTPTDIAKALLKDQAFGAKAWQIFNRYVVPADRSFINNAVYTQRNSDFG